MHLERLDFARLVSQPVSSKMLLSALPFHPLPQPRNQHWGWRPTQPHSALKLLSFIYLCHLLFLFIFKNSFFEVII